MKRRGRVRGSSLGGRAELGTAGQGGHPEAQGAQAIQLLLGGEPGTK